MSHVEISPHQIKAVNDLKNGAILYGDTGVGKSRTALAYYWIRECGGSITELKEPSHPKDLYVITTAKKRDGLDWTDEALPFRITKDRETSLGGVKIVVDSWNNISKYEEVKDAFFIFDEQRLVGSGAWVKSFYKIVASNRWILLSATPGDTWVDYIPVFVANGFYKNKSDFVRQHVVYNSYAKFPKVERYLGTRRLERHERDVLVAMPLVRHTVRHSRYKAVDYDREQFDLVVKKRWHVYEDRPIRDIAELLLVARKVVNSHPSRVDAVRDLLQEHPRIVVFYNFNFELEALRTFCGGIAEGRKDVDDGRGFAYAEWNGHKHEDIPTTESWIYLVQYTAGSEGWNCITTDTMVFYSLNYSHRIMEQARGRIDRINTPYIDLYYYTLKSSSLIDAAIQKVLNRKKNFNLRAFERSLEG